MSSFPSNNLEGHLGVTNINRYKWICHDRPGKFCEIDKSELLIEERYQRALNATKVLEIASAWSWVACGAILVAERDGFFWAVDGQHRVAAARRRSDILLLPCMVYQSEGLVDEAKGFLRANTNRKPIDAIARHRARLAAQDENAIFVQSTLERCGLSIGVNSDHPKSVRCVGWCSRRARENPRSFEKVLAIVAKLAFDADLQKPLPERVLDGLWHIDRHCGLGLNDRRLTERIELVGIERLNAAATRAAQLYVRGGAKVYAAGMLEEINKGLRNKYTLEIGDG